MQFFVGFSAKPGKWCESQTCVARMQCKRICNTMQFNTNDCAAYLIEYPLTNGNIL